MSPIGASLNARDRDGFTLVEVLVVLLIIAVLLGIAAVVFLGARTAAQNRTAQSTARHALVTAKALFGVDEDYRAATVSALEEAEPQVVFVDGSTSSDGPETASVDAPDEDTFVVAVYSESGTCFFIRDEAVPARRGTTYAERSSDGSDCTAGLTPPTFTLRW